MNKEELEKLSDKELSKKIVNQEIFYASENTFTDYKDYMYLELLYQERNNREDNNPKN